MIDTHVHLQDERYERDLPAVLRRAREVGVTALIIPGTHLASSRKAVQLADRYADGSPRLYAAVGVHPTEAQTLNDATFESLEDLAQSSHVVPIGEIGLAYYWPQIPNRGWECADPEVQRRALDRQLALAADRGLPVIVHDRDAHEDTLHAIQSWTADDPDRCGTLHAYAAGVEHLPGVMDTGFYIGIDGPVTFEKAESIHQVARTVRIEHLLLETDGPYLTPVPHRGQRNEPAYLRHIAQRIAEIKQIPVAALDEPTTRNAQTLFDLA